MLRMDVREPSDAPASTFNVFVGKKKRLAWPRLLVYEDVDRGILATSSLSTASSYVTAGGRYTAGVSADVTGVGKCSRSTKFHRSLCEGGLYRLLVRLRIISQPHEALDLCNVANELDS